MKTEELMQLGLNREQADKILAMNGRDIERVKSAGQADKVELLRLRGEMKEKEDLLAAYAEKDFAGLENELKIWKEKAEQIEKESLLRENRAVIRYEADRLYRECGVKNAELLDALLDWESIALSEGKISGAKEQLDSLKEKYSYLFETDEPMPSFSASMGYAQAKDESASVREAMGI